MQIRKATLEKLESMGIRVSPFPTKEAEEKCFEAEVKKYMRWYDYSKEVAIEKVCKLFNSEGSWYGHWYNCTKVYISYDGTKLFTRTVQKSKSYNVEDILNWVNRDKKAYSGTFGAFTEKMQGVCKKMGYLNSWSVYPTTYGIGVWVFYNWDLEKDLKNVSDLLNKFGVEYYTEFSDARWVFRFKISKKSINLDKISKAV